jgi:hypothetical protein
MLLLLMHTSLSRLVSALVLCLIATCAHAQNEVVRAVVLGQTVEFTMARSNEAADFETVSVRIGGKLLKQFATPYGSFLIVVATFNGYDGDYLLLRTSMGQGACAGGSLYGLKFSSIGDQQPPTRINVNVSPVLTTCLGEFPPVKFTYGAKGDLVISVSGYELRGDVWLRWVPERNRRLQKNVVQHNKSHRRKRTALSSAGVGYLLGCMPGGSIPALNASVRDVQVLS